jgi:soluble lytic murein transglycosylase
LLSKRTVYTLLLWFFGGFISCAAQPLQPDFSQGLQRRADMRNGEAAAFFAKALDSSNALVRRAAAAELGSLLYAGEELSAPVLNRVRREAAGSWAAAFDALSVPAADASPADAGPSQIREKALAFILSSGEYNSVTGVAGDPFPDEAALYVLRECRNRDALFFSPAENAAIEGHIAASRSRFSEALVFFRTVLEAEPRIFVRYPALLNDLGRCLQYAAIGTDGLYLLLSWEQDLAESNAAEDLRPGDIPGIRFRLLFFAARIARQRGFIDQGIELFIRALPFAPDSEQADACIWYILDSTLSRGLAAVFQRLTAFVPQWHNDAYFFDVLDRLSRELTLRRQWKELIMVFSLLQNRTGSAGHPKSAGGASTAKYAYIIGRALDEGYLSPEETRLAAETLAADASREALSRAYLQIAYDEGSGSLYYRSQSAAALDEPFWELPQEAAPAKTGAGSTSAAMEFLLGFFSHNAAAFAPRYIKALEQELAAGDLYLLAKALGEAGLYADSIRLVSVYLEREDYTAAWQDMELYYPQPFKELVEQYAQETGLAPELLFGLIRTESAFQSDIVSRAGAVGLTQLMPATAQEMADRIRRQGGPDYAQKEQEGGPNLRDPETNIHIGAVYLDYLSNRMEDTVLALLAYNGGMNRVRRWRTADSRATPGGLPTDLFLETTEYPETREYGRRVLAAAAAYRELYYAHKRIPPL